MILSKIDRLFIRRYIFSKQKSIVKLLSFISVFGIALGVCAMIIVLSVMSGFDREIKNRNLKAMPHLVISNPSQDVQKILKQEIVELKDYSKQDVLLRTVDGLHSGAIAYGINEDDLTNIASKMSHSVEIIETSNGNITTKKPRIILSKIVLNKKEIAIGYDLARSLGIVENDEVTLITPESLFTPDEPPIYEKFIVKNLVRTEVAELDSRYIFFNQKYYPSRFMDAASLEKGLEARFKEPYTAITIADNLKKNGFKNISSWQDLNKALYYSLKMEKRLMSIFLALTVLVSSFSIMSVLYLLVTQKRKDIGILKAMGARTNQITNLFLKIGVFIGFGGVLMGTILGLGICYVLAHYPVIQLPDVYYDTSFPVLVNPVTVIAIIVFGFIMTMLSSYFPAKLASQQDPINIFR